jgi:superfamily I DNA and/or RNA helicase
VRSRYIGKKLNQNRKKTIGFVGDMRRINVSLSRAKDICIIVGDLKRLSSLSKKWKEIISEAM